MMKKLLMACLVMALAPLAWAADPDPYPFFVFENDAQLISVTPNVVNEAVGTYEWATDQKTAGGAALHLQNFTAGDWKYGLTIHPLVAGASVTPVLTGYKYITMDIYGDNSKRLLYVDFVTGANQAYWNLSIDFTGWKHIALPMAGANVGSGAIADVWAGVQALVIYDNGAGTPANIYIDNIAATNTAPDLSVTLNAMRRTVTVDGSAADWDLTACQPTYVDVSARGANRKLAANVRYCWDANYLYFLIQEAGASISQGEVATAGDYMSPWSFDGLSLWIDLTGDKGGAFDINPWFAFNSSGIAGLWTCRVNNDGANMNTDPLIGGSCATSGTFANHNRTIEARMKWTDIAASVAPGRLPAGGLLSAISAGYRIGSNPLLVENNYLGQSFVGGVQYAQPNGIDANSRYIQFTEPNAAKRWEVFE